VQAAKLRMSQDVAKLNSELMEQSAESAAQDWALCRDQALPFFTEHSSSKDMALWRLSVPQTAPVLNLPNSASEALIEWHGAQRWIWAPLSEVQAIRQAAEKVGGQATLFRRPQQASAAVNVNTSVFAPLDVVQQRIQQALKNEFDPAGIFSPRRLNAYF
jgi:glycolate oxidase FAD binding subunit